MENEIKWSLNEALALIHSIQPLLHKHQWHVALGGGVLNKGWSAKDVDLYVLPFGTEPEKDGIPDVIPILTKLWGDYENIGYGSDAIFEYKIKFEIMGKRADVFVGRRKKE